MKKFAILSLLVLLSFPLAWGQSSASDIPASQLPPAVKQVLEEYLGILRASRDLDDCAHRFKAIAGGALVNEDGLSLRSTVQPYSLKKDFENVRFYAQPTAITRVNVSASNGMGYGPSAVRGKVYKIWVGKASGQAGMPAPISIIVPESHAFINSPKVVGIGSL